MKYPFERILSLLQFAEVGELEKVIGENGVLQYQDLRDISGERYMIEYDEEIGEDIIVIIGHDEVTSDLCPHTSWDGIMFLLPRIHKRIHDYERHCTTHNQRMIFQRIHTLVLRAENSITDLYNLPHSWNQLSIMSTVLEECKKYLPKLES